VPEASLPACIPQPLPARARRGSRPPLGLHRGKCVLIAAFGRHGQLSRLRRRGARVVSARRAATAQALRAAIVSGETGHRLFQAAGTRGFAASMSAASLRCSRRWR
jgi:hypothetical protein